MPYTPEQIKNHHNINFELPIELIKFIDEKMLIAGMDGYSATAINIDKRLWYPLGRDQILDLYKDKNPKPLNLVETIDKLIQHKIRMLYIQHGWKSVTFIDNDKVIQILFDSKEEERRNYPNGRGGW